LGRSQKNGISGWKSLSKLAGVWNERLHGLAMRFLVWRVKNLSDRAFVVILAALVGLFTGLAASLLKYLVRSIRILLTGDFASDFVNWLYILFPLLGIGITVLITTYLFREVSSHGITDIIKAISRGSSKIDPKKIYTRLIASAVTTGFGGSVGIEAPIATTGAAFGSNLGRVLRLHYKNRSLLIGCGAAGAIAAMFNAPIAGVIFTIEIILIEVSISSFIPLLIASVTAAIVASGLSGGGSLFYFSVMEGYQNREIPWFILLGICSGWVSLYFIRINTQVELWFSLIRSKLRRVLWGGTAIGLLIFVFPPIYGEGYNSIELLLQGAGPELLNSTFIAGKYDNTFFLLLFLVFLIFMKPLATALTISTGGGGGVFAPSLFTGGVAGFTFGIILSLIYPSWDISLATYTLIGMSGVMSGVLHAPLTAIFLIAEITSGYSLFIPLMLVSAISYTTIYYFERNSIYTKSLVEKGELIVNNKDLEVLSLMELNSLIEKDLLTIRPDANLRKLVLLIKKSKRNIFPVVNEEGKLEGIVTLDDVREIMFDNEVLDQVVIRSVMNNPPGFIEVGDSMRGVMSKFETTGAWNLPVIKDGLYIGLISKSSIFNSYRNRLQKQSKV